MTPIKPSGRARVQTFMVFENFDQVQPGVWDAGSAVTAADKANQWLSEHADYQVVETPRFESRLVEVTQDGKRRTFITTLTLLYISTQFEVKDIRDGQEETPQTAATSHTAGSTPGSNPKFSRLQDAYDFVERITGVRIPNSKPPG